MRSINLPEYNPRRAMAEQLAEHFARCTDPDWVGVVFHLSVESITGHKAGAVSGDLYMIEGDSHGWEIVILTHAKDRPGHFTGDDLIETVAEFATDAAAWEWLRQPVSQAYYLLDEEAGIASATESIPAPEPSPLCNPELLVPMTKHPYSFSQSFNVKRADGTSYDAYPVHFGFGRILVGCVDGTSAARQAPGYPILSIPEAHAVADQVMHRWNSHAGLTAQLKRARDILLEAIETSGHKVAGPSDSRAAEHGEPVWVREARGLIASIGGSVA